MSLIQVTDLAYVRLRAPDLDQMEAFLIDLGLTRSARTADTLYMRGTGNAHHVHVTHLGSPSHIGIAFLAASEADLHTLAALPGSSAVESMKEPGGGRHVILFEPNGYQIEVVHGMEFLPEIPVATVSINSGAEPVNRRGRNLWSPVGPPRIKRIGHAVLGSSKPHETVDWFKSTLGLVCTDEIYMPDGTLMSSFLRINKGEEFVDHHSFLVTQHETTGWHHVAFEAQDWNDVLAGHAHMKKAGHQLLWEAGRHGLGGQVGMYWADPWGRAHEFWTDSDRLNVHDKQRTWSLNEVRNGPEWNQPAPEFFTLHP